MLTLSLDPVHSKTKPKISPLILVVDDNYDNLIYACGVLELFQLRYIVASSGSSALDLAKDKLPDLILLDMVMPQTDGMSMASILKRNPLTNHIPIIAVTGLSFFHHKQQILNAGCDDYLCKPYLIEDLETKLASFLNLREFTGKQFNPHDDSWRSTRSR